MLMNIDVNNNTGNCLAQDTTTMLTISDAPKELEISAISSNRRKDDDAVQDLEQQLNILLPLSLSEYSDNVLSYISGFVVKSIKKRISCLKCIAELETCYDEQDSSLALIKRKSRGGLLFPTMSVRRICRKMENKIQHAFNILGSLPPKRVLITLLMKESHELLLDANLFPGLVDHVFDYAPYETSHKKNLIDNIIKTYANIRINSLANKINESITGEKIRKTLSKLILFKHQ